MSEPQQFSDLNFNDEVLRCPTPTLVDFWAPWCGPCRMLGPVIEELASEYADSIKVGKVNVDESPGVATAYGIHSIPTLMLFKDGEAVEQLVGLQPKSEIETAIARVTSSETV